MQIAKFKVKNNSSQLQMLTIAPAIIVQIQKLIGKKLTLMKQLKLIIIIVIIIQNLPLKSLNISTNRFRTNLNPRIISQFKLAMELVKKLKKKTNCSFKHFRVFQPRTHPTRI